MRSTEPRSISNPLPVNDFQLVNGIFKLKDMINSSKTRRDLEKLLPYYNIVMVQASRIKTKEVSIRRCENMYDMYWDKYNELPGDNR